jgi:hypothetical protein
MTLESALRQGGPLVGAWDYQSDGTLRIYSVSSGAKLIESIEIGDDKREDANEQLVGRNARIGGTHSDAFGNAKYVWAMDDRASIWSEKEQLFDFQPVAGFRRVSTFFDVENPGHRGVRVEWIGGASRIVVEEHDKAPRSDPTYNADNLSVDIEWAYYIGRDLAVWSSVPHYDQLTDSITNHDHLKIREAARELADEVDKTPDLGNFEPVSKTIGKVGKANDIALRYAPSPTEARSRIVDVRVQLGNGKTSERRIKQGSHNDVAAFLRRVQTPSVVLRAMNALLRTQ